MLTWAEDDGRRMDIVLSRLCSPQNGISVASAFLATEMQFPKAAGSDLSEVAPPCHSRTSSPSTEVGIRRCRRYGGT